MLPRPETSPLTAPRSGLMTLSLPEDFQLGQYRLLKVLAQGGFGMTYLATDTDSGEKVVIKENLPRTFAYRRENTYEVCPVSNEGAFKERFEWSLSRFIDEANTLSKLNHPNIVKVLQAFKTLGTAYYVMPWVGGRELSKAAPSAEELNEAWLAPILQKLLNALNYLHSAGVVHRDLKPSNILVTQEGTPILIDFGTARSLVGEHTGTIMESPGYTPIEQLQTEGNKGPWSDIYALGATCYRLITGEKPPTALERLSDSEDCATLSLSPQLQARFSQNFLQAIDKALQLHPEQRWQSAEEWQNSLTSPPSEEKIELPRTQSAAPKKTTPLRRKPLSTILQSGKNKSQKLWLISAVLTFAAISLVLAAAYKKYSPLLAHSESIAEPTTQQALPEETPPPAQPPITPKQYQEFINLFGGPQHNLPPMLPGARRKELAHRVQENPQLVEYSRSQAENTNTPANWYAWSCLQMFNLIPEANRKEGLRWLRKAAEANYAPAQLALGYRYEKGLDIERNAQQATFWYGKAKSLPAANYHLGLCYLRSSGSNTDIKTGIDYIRKAAENGYPEAMYTLGEYYRRGTHCEQNQTAAIQWFRKAIQENSPDAMIRLGCMHRDGLGVDRNEAEAQRLHQMAFAHWQNAAEAGEVSAIIHLAECYTHGWGTEVNHEQVFHLYTLAAARKDPEAICRLAMCHAQEIGTVRDDRQAIHLMTEAAAMGLPEAQYRLAELYKAQAQQDEQLLSRVFHCYEQAAKQNLAPAQYELALCYEFGTGTEKNLNLAFDWYQKSAEMGHAPAMHRLGLFHEKGVISAPAPQEAFKWYTRAAERGYANAIFSLGVCYDWGIGTPQDHTAALEQYTKAAEQGHSTAMYNLALCYEEGTGTAIDEHQAFIWFGRAAAAGQTEAQFKLGTYYYHGKETDKNELTALEWFNKAAERQQNEAQYYLGLIYENGISGDNGTELQPDSVTAFEWYKKATLQDNPDAIVALGRCFENGIGTAQDLEKAFECYSKAAALEHADGLYHTARFLQLGINNITVDVDMAIKMYREAAAKGHEEAQQKLNELTR